MKKLIIHIILLSVLSVDAAIICVGPSSTGSGNGSDWNNKAQWSSVTLTRGNTYYLADGSYAGKAFNTAASSTTLITIKKAIVGDATVEGITGWNSADGDGQATFTSSITITTSYWILDGMKGPTWSRVTSDYGFLFNSPSFCFLVDNTSADIQSISISRVAGIAPAGDIEKYFFASTDSSRNINTVTVSHCYGNGWCNFFKGTGGASHGQRFRTNWVAEYNIVLNVFSSAANHGEDINNGYGFMQDWHIRYNFFEGTANTAPTGVIVVLNDDSGPYHIYGNVFRNKLYSDGLIAGIHYPVSGVVYNNTFDNCVLDGGNGYGVWVGGGGGVTADVRNNLVANMPADYSTSGTASHNMYYNVTRTPSDTSRLVLNVDPFVNRSQTNYHLAFATNVGFTLSSPYNVDVDGVTRSHPDRGAYEYVGSASTPTCTITSPTSSSTYSTSSSTIDLSGTSSDTDGVTGVTWSNDRGGSGSCTGTTSWSKTGITLQSGHNIITVTASNGTNTGSDSLDVTYTPPATVTGLRVTNMTVNTLIVR